MNAVAAVLGVVLVITSKFSSYLTTLPNIPLCANHQTYRVAPHSQSSLSDSTLNHVLDICIYIPSPNTLSLVNQRNHIMDILDNPPPLSQ